MTAQKWVVLLVISEGQTLYNSVDRNHPAKEEEEAVSTDSDSRKLSLLKEEEEAVSTDSDSRKLSCKAVDSKIYFLSYTSHISKAKEPRVAGAYNIGLHQYKTFLSSQKILLYNAILDYLLYELFKRAIKPLNHFLYLKKDWKINLFQG